MILRAWLPGVMVLALAACDPPVPDSAAGVGFGDYQGYLAEQDALRAQRDQQLSGQVSVTPPTATGAPTPAQVQGAPVLTTDAPGTATGVAVAVASNPDISDEQDFGAVSGRESIEANAERLARQRQQYQQVAPTALPNRPAGDGPSIVAYALQTTNQVGEQIYSRALGSDRRARVRALPHQTRRSRRFWNWAVPSVTARGWTRMGTDLCVGGAPTRSGLRFRVDRTDLAWVGEFWGAAGVCRAGIGRSALYRDGQRRSRVGAVM